MLSGTLEEQSVLLNVDRTGDHCVRFGKSPKTLSGSLPRLDGTKCPLQKSGSGTPKHHLGAVSHKGTKLRVLVSPVS